MDIIVTTPKSQIHAAANEAKDALAGKVHYYFRVFNKNPKKLQQGDKVFYVENGYITGFATVYGFANMEGTLLCQTQNKEWNGEVVVWMRCDSWNWIKPIKMKGFQ